MSTSLANGLAIIDLLVEAQGAVGLGDIARRLRLSKSGVHALLTTLVSSGYVERGAGGMYRLAHKAWSTLNAFPTSSLIEAANPVMRRLVSTIKEGVILGVLTGFDVVYVHLVEGSEAVRVHARVGDCIASHCTSTGLALLAFQDEAALDRIVPAALRAFTSETIVKPGALRQELARVRMRGYSINRGGWNADVGGIAAPIPTRQGPVAAGLCIAVPRYRMTRRWIARAAPSLIAAAAEIGEALDGPGARRLAAAS
ncbi:MAG: IclR family transcriptional regulator [Hyphomicrobiales bacterium]